MNKEKMNYTILRLKEMSLCNKYQNIITTINDINIILKIICNEVEEK